MDFKINAAVGCNKGRVRRNNEDNLYFNGRILPEEHEGIRHPARRSFYADSEPFFCVFDGMGGEAKGERASFLSAKAMAKASLATSDPERITSEMNREVCEYAASQQVPRMGSTVAALCFGRTGITGFNVGDSRCYRMRDGCLQRLSKDHARVVPVGKQKLLTQHIGIEESDFTLEPHLFCSNYRDGDQYLLCTDGFTDRIMDRRIREILAAPAGLEEKLGTLRSRLESKGATDNSTALLVRIAEGD